MLRVPAHCALSTFKISCLVCGLRTADSGQHCPRRCACRRLKHQLCRVREIWAADTQPYATARHRCGYRSLQYSQHGHECHMDNVAILTGDMLYSLIYIKQWLQACLLSVGGKLANIANKNLPITCSFQFGN